MKRLPKQKPKNGTNIDGSFLRVDKAILQHYGPDVAVFLCNLIEKWRMFIEMNKLKDGVWFWQTHKQITGATKLTDRKIRKCKNLLFADKVIEVKMMQWPPKEFYRINAEALEERTLVTKRNELFLTKRNESIGNETLGIKEKEINKKETTTTKEELVVEIFESSNGWIVPNLFERYWRLYPRQINKNQAQKKWNELCSKPGEQRPNWRVIKKALEEQKKTELWRKQPNLIPYPYTWLNESRWTNDPEAMKLFHPENKGKPKTKIEGGDRWFLDEESGNYYNDEGEWLIE